jgi:uncharacterized membrane protein (DUF106 family)
MNDSNETKKIEVEEAILEKMNKKLGGIEINLEINNQRLGCVEREMKDLTKYINKLEIKDDMQNVEISKLESDVKPIKIIKTAFKIPMVKKLSIGIILFLIVFVVFAGAENLYNFIKDGIIKILGI